MLEETVSEDGAPRREVAQAAVVLLAVLVLLLAAAAVPGAPSLPTGEDGGTGDGEPGDLEPVENGDGVEFTWDWLPDLDIDWLWDLFERGNGERPACVITLGSDPVPGQELQVQISVQEGPLDGAPVSFNGQPVGETDRAGIVTGTVPYEETLEIRVETPDGTECIGVGSIEESGVVTAGTSPVVGSTATYEVDGEVTIRVPSEPEPGETITVRAEIEGTPMAGATVTVDGEAVGTTDDDGQLDLEAPDDGSSSFVVGVERGDFGATVTVDIALLQLAIVGDGSVPIPGAEGTVLLTLGSQPVSGATVTVDGAPVGQTDGDGTLPVTIPVDPTAEFAASAHGQQVAETYLSLFWRPLVALGVLITMLAVAAHALVGWRGTGLVLGGTVFGAGSVVAQAHWGTGVALGVLAVGVTVALVLVATRSDRLSRPTPPSPDIVAMLQRIARALERSAIVAGRAVRAMLRGIGLVLRSPLRAGPRLLSVLLETLRAGIAGLRRIGEVEVSWAAGRARLVRLARWLSGHRLALTVLGLAAVGGYAVDGGRGVLLAVAIVGLGLLLVTLRPTRQVTEVSGEAAGGLNVRSVDGGHGLEARSLRVLWRSFSRQIAPRSWRTRTPTEVEHRAIALGYPGRPVRSLAESFRAVEYGGRPLRANVLERARRAYRKIAIWRASEEEGDRL